MQLCPSSPTLNSTHLVTRPVGARRLPSHPALPRVLSFQRVQWGDCRRKCYFRFLFLIPQPLVVFSHLLEKQELGNLERTAALRNLEETVNG
ncbi:hypothetical protein NDU88_004254 [Pleurodeles waltl]|uniref:Uncharacterized protein n=1 Tax=Pleurodeles waltl TaxID=8319 RepID=A0AAV7PF31_PLEWA|nr:hypothetical protein NDU88_004254 [Pleurodeles waltl]